MDNDQAGTLTETGTAAPEQAPPAPATTDPPDPQGDSSSRAGTPRSSLARALDAAGLLDLAGPLDDQGYLSLKDLGTAEKDVRAAVEKACKDVKAGELNRIVALWKSATSQGATPDIPKLPAGTKVDLTAAEVKVGDVEFKFPSELATKKSDKTYKSAAELSTEEWMVIARATGLAYGIDLDKAHRSTRDGDALAPEPALVWMVPGHDFMRGWKKEGEVTSELRYTSELINLVHNRIVGATAEVGAPFVSAAAAASRNERYAASSTVRTLYMSGRYRYIFAVLDLTFCTAPSPAFEKAVDQAIAKPGDQERFKALDAVFRRFGHVVPREVALGGQLYFTTSRETKGKVEESAVRDTVTAAVNAKYGGASGGASVSFEDGRGSKVDAQSIVGSTSFTAVGGDITLVSTPSEWAGTVKDPNSWAVVERSQLVPLSSRLPEKKRVEVERIWAAGLARIWGARPPQGYVLPDFDGLPFTLANVTADEEALQPVHIDGRPATIAPSSRLSRALDNGLAWTLVYTGDTTTGGADGVPVYRIEEFQDEALAAAREQETARVVAKNKAIREATGDDGDYEPVPVPRVALCASELHGNPWATCVDAQRVAGENPSTSTASWSVHPVPSALVAGKNEVVLMNRATKQVLGAPVSSSDLSPDGSTWQVVPLVAPSTEPAATDPTAWRVRTHTRGS